ncbi:hypothetical protein MJO28_008484 [Puccinia striiformis f. sp. tritici]|uniref:Exocyst complex protein EXO70 n=4 Tax=Puccinia striiformis TaxID=27350 RepID=A0A0L0VGW3_9BASI|nr:uncharacterized protein Pst134EA_032868 [Puccinia striiformis f. sp. tritici]XP_047805203.1 hypothetical protein Pst134EA_033507 [Puccinia striiformis f. sp. tritici]KNE98264.1 hypothetical protein PSTG_08538 [Puccinia striiformis f. sp. tritici PST-78]POW21193.1 hypothetical protein PSHT_02686 [Puccinia striiformis]KAH9441568.1 hypothetical protein Pst134EA_032868 [Puccinia striiformis f. sp. tritici]KAH9452612.1 hypothetical protein Pst134EB_016568 [Puccinia striiformis f. sp. tritici]KA
MSSSSIQPQHSIQHSSSLDQSAADLVLLSNSLDKSKRITDNLAKMLSGFDDRLSRLERTIVPIHNDTRTLTRINANIDATILTVDKLLAHHDAAVHQEVVIQNGPNPNQLGSFISSLDEIVKSIQTLSRTEAPVSESTIHAEKLLETGVRSLSDIFAGWVHESTGPPLSDPIHQTADPTHPLGLPSNMINKLQKLFAYLQTLSKSLPNNQSIQDVNKQILSVYGASRSKYVCASLKSLSDSCVEAIRNGDGFGLFSTFISCLLDMLNIEHKAVLAVYKGASPIQIKGIFSQVISGSLELLTETGQSVNSVIKRSLSSYIGVAFDTYAAITDQLSRFDEEVRRPAGRKENELGDLLHGFKGSCLRSLPEFIADTKTFGEKLPVGSEASNTMTSEMTIVVVEYLKMLCQHPDMVESLLVILGDGKWIFGAHSNPKTSVSHGTSNDEAPLLVKYLDDALSTLYTAIEARSKNLKLRSTVANTITSVTARNGVGAIYMLNNFTYIRRELLESAVLDIYGDQLSDQLNKRVRTCKVRYLEIWSPLISALMDGGGEEVKFGLGAVKSALPGQHAGAERRDVKDRFGRFNEAFEEVIQLHQAANLANNDPDLKDQLRHEIERMIMPTYAKFTQRHEGGQFSKNPSKYLKFSAEQLEERLDELFH